MWPTLGPTVRKPGLELGIVMSSGRIVVAVLFTIYISDLVEEEARRQVCINTQTQ